MEDNYELYRLMRDIEWTAYDVQHQKPYVAHSELEHKSGWKKSVKRALIAGAAVVTCLILINSRKP